MVAAVGLSASGCADVTLPRIVLDDGPVPAAAAGPAVDAAAVLTGQRPVRRADPDIQGFPNLSSVPARPTAFSTPAERQALFDRLQADQAESARTGEAVRGATPGAAPLSPVPEVPAAPPPVPQPVRR